MNEILFSKNMFSSLKASAFKRQDLREIHARCPTGLSPSIFRLRTIIFSIENLFVGVLGDSSKEEAQSSRADLGRYRTNLSAMHDEINTRTQRQHNAAFFYDTSGAALAKLYSRAAAAGTLWLKFLENKIND